jgi:hypothetical protein
MCMLYVKLFCVLSLQYFEKKIFVCGFVVLYLYCFYFVLSAFICIFMTFHILFLLLPYSEWTAIAQSVQCWAMGWTIGVLGFDSRQGLGIFLFTTASRTALWPTQPPAQWVAGAFSLGVKRPEREANHSPPSSAEVKEWVELYLHSPIRLHGVVLS